MPRPEKKFVTFEIDGREVSAPEGSMLVDGAKYGDVEIPVFCYEPKLGAPVGACRMCLVEIEGMPKLQTACSTAVKDGMVVNTTPDRVKAAQNAIVEFLLVNHPLDCPVCDKGGECPLQDITFGWGSGRSRFIEPQRHFKKPLELSPLVPDGGELRPVSWERALDEAAKALDRAGERAAALVGGEALNEEGYLVQFLMRNVLGSPHVDSRMGGELDPEQARILARPDLSAKVSDIDFAGAILVLDTELVDEMPILDLRVRKAARRSDAKVVTVTSRPSTLDRNSA